jgi:YVTN family beta-propeller protein
LIVALALSGSAVAAPLAYVTSEKDGVGVIDLDKMTLTKTIPSADGPRGLGLTADGAELLVANKKTGDLSVIDTRTGSVVRRVKIGKNPEFVRVFGQFAYVTHEPGDSGAPAAKGAGKQDGGAAAGPNGPGKGGADDDDDANKPLAQIALIDLKTFKVAHTVISGHETEGVEFSHDGKLMLVTNEGDDTVSVYDSRTGAPVKTIKLLSGGRPRGIRAAPDGQSYVVTLESASKLVVLDAGNYQVLKTIDTKLGPYGVSFDPSGQRLFVAASRDGVIQVFDARSYAHLADVAVGKRCWHFSFTPDGTKLLAACGRSDAVYVVDAQTYQPVAQVGGLPLAWGIVTYPKSMGSLEAR